MVDCNLIARKPMVESWSIVLGHHFEHNISSPFFGLEESWLT